VENITLHKIAEKREDFSLCAEGLSKVEAGGKELCVALHKGELYGCIAKCPHAGGDLTQGYIDASGNIVCPLHHYKFSLKSGKNVTGEGYFLKTFGVEEMKDGVFIKGL